MHKLILSIALVFLSACSARKANNNVQAPSEQEIDLLNKQIQEKKNEFSTLQKALQEIQEIKGRKDSSPKDLASLEKKIEDLKNQRNVTQQEIESLTKQIETQKGIENENLDDIRYKI